MSCSTRICVRPRCFSTSKVSASLPFSPLRRPAAGSSSSRTRGRCASARATASSRSWPSGSDPAGSAARSSRPTSVSAACASSSIRRSSPHCQGTRSIASTKPVRVHEWHPTIAFPRTSRCASGGVVWNTVARPADARRCAVHRVTSRPSTTTLPSSMRSRPEMQPSSVDFPAPFGPIRHVSEPRPIARSTASTAATAPNALVTPRTSQARPAASGVSTGSTISRTLPRRPPAACTTRCFRPTCCPSGSRCGSVGPMSRAGRRVWATAGAWSPEPC